MNDRLRFEPAPAEEDPILHDYLSALPNFAPRVSLETKVLTHVWRAPPRWVGQVQRRWVESVETGRIWFVLGALAAGSLIPLGVAAGLTIAFADQIGALGTWMVARFGPSIAGVLAAYWASSTQSVTSWWAANVPLHLGAWVGGVAGVSTLSAIGLFLTLRRGNKGVGL